MNKPIISIASLAVVCLFASSCSGNHSSSALPTGTAEKQATSFGTQSLKHAIAALPFNPKRDHWVRDSTPGLNHTVNVPRGRFPSGIFPGGQSQGIHSLATVQTSDHGGQAGTVINPSQNYWGIYANQSVSSLMRVNAGDYLYAPTMKGPYQDCLEITTIYTHDAPAVGTWDFCASPGQFHNAKTVTTDFVNAYVRDLGNGQPQYTAESVWSGTDQAWHALIFNYTASEWEDMYADSGNGSINGGEGWSIFETHYFNAPETCTPIVNVRSNNIQIINGDGNPELVTYNNGGSQFEYGDCFNTSDPYVLTQVSLTYAWLVSQPDPPPCTADSYGYCAYNQGTTHDGTISCFDGLHWHNYTQTTTTTYGIYNSTDLLETAIQTITNSDGGEGNCPQADTSWDPQEPSQQYSDPNLP
jgi:hypothetical protein